MLQVLTLTLPFFAVILAGFIARTCRFFPRDAGNILARFAFFVALPAFLFLQLASTPVAEMWNPGFIALYEIGTLTVFTAAAAAATVFRITAARRAIFALNATYSNYGYIGVPLSLAAFGPRAAIPLALILLADSIVLVVLTAATAALSPGIEFARTLKTTLADLAKNPLLLSVVVGFLWSLAGFPLPQIPEKFLVMLAGAAAPAALFALGITLVGSRINDARAEIFTVSAFKLIIHPALIAALFLTLPGVDPVAVKVAILAAALPIAANVYAMSEYYNAYTGATAAAILVSTIGASVTVPAVLYFLL